LGVESGAHQFAVALLTAVNVQLKSLQDCVVFGFGFWSGHARTVRPVGSGHQRTNLAKAGAPVLHAGCRQRRSGRRWRCALPGHNSLWEGLLSPATRQDQRPASNQELCPSHRSTPRYSRHGPTQSRYW
jgi:hypothetical protein